MKSEARMLKVSMRYAALAAVLLGAAAGLGLLEPRAATAQVKSPAEVKSLLSPQLPAGASEISAAMTSAQVGKTITVRGYVAMSKDAFAANEASFTLVDEAARTGERPAADALPATSDAVPAASRATVVVVDASGAPVRGSLSNQHGLRPGAEVFVTGTVRAANGTDSLVISATAMHIPRSPAPPGLFVDREPANAADVSEARKGGTLKTGEAVVLRGRVGGSKQPFVSGRAVFTLMGRGLKPCNENPDDRCTQPWDYCCETREDILANSVTVQVLDEKGQILRTDMKGRRGLKELSEMVVVGKVASADGKAVVVTASSIYPAP